MSRQRLRHRGRGVAAIGASFPLVARRARTDLAALIGIVVLVAITSAIAVAVPREINATLDGAAREAVAAAGTEADLLLRSPIGDLSGYDTTTAERFLTFAGEVPERLPAALADAAAQVSTGILGPVIEGTSPVGLLRVRIGVLDPAVAPELRVALGELPHDGGSEVQGENAARLDVVVSTATAEAAGVTVGDSVTLGGGSRGAEFVLHVVAVADAVDATARRWSDLPGVWDPQVLAPRGDVSAVTFTVLSDAAAFDRVSKGFPDVATGIIRTSFDPSVFDVQRFDEVEESIDEIETSPWLMSEGAPLTVTATSGYEQVLKGVPTAARAATAQLSTLAAGLLGVAVFVTVLAGTALARRRQAEIALLRSRGASLGLIGVHAATESVVITLFGVGLGVAAASASGSPIDSLLLVAGAAIIVAAAPVVSTLRLVVATRSSSLARPFRIAGVAALVAAAVTAVAALRSGTSVQGSGIDPLALGAPILSAAVVALGLSPLAAAMAQPMSRLASRARGTGTLLAASSARDGRSGVTLVALILASSVAITSLVMLQTVAAGQEAASWQAVGADVRIEGAADAAGLVSEFESAGATAAAFAELNDVSVKGEGNSASATVRAVEGDYAQLLSTLPADLAERTDAQAVNRLTEQDEEGPSLEAQASQPVPALFDARLTKIAGDENVTIDIDGTLVPVTVVGSPIARPESLHRPLAVVDRSRLLAYLAAAANANAANANANADAAGEQTTSETTASVALTTVLATGGNSSATAAAVDGESSVMIRDDILDQQRSGVLISGVAAATLQSLVGTGILAVLALVVTTVLGARRRGRTLALLGALGVPKRASIALAAGELVPLVVSGIVGGGIAATVAIVAAGSAFGSDLLVGGHAVITVPPWLPLAIIGVAAAALAIAVAIDRPLSRRVSTAEILRTGEES